MMPYTPSELIASTYSTPALTLASTNPPPLNGITAHTASAGITDRSGAVKYKNRLALVGTITSLISSFTTSANACSRPNGPILFGPMRTCIQPITLRSHHTYIATAMIKGTAIARILPSVHPKMSASFMRPPP